MITRARLEPRPNLPTLRRDRRVLGGLALLLACACSLDDADPEGGHDIDRAPLSVPADSSDSERPSGLASGPLPSASVSSACLQAPSVANCCKNGELVTEGTAGPDAQNLAPGSAHCVLGYAGSDAYTTGTLDDVIVGGPGDDTLAAKSGNDTIMGGDDDDTLYGDEGDDALYGGDGFDVLWGSSGVDLLDGGAGVDILHGGDGYDLLIGGMGVDSVYGDAGDDVAVIYDLCEIGGTGELIDGGAGYDIVIAPVDATGLAALGVALVGIEKVIVDTSKSHLSECGPPPPPKATFDHSLTMRHEPSLGCTRRMPGQYPAYCAGSSGWAFTEARVWVDVPETTTKFLAATAGATAAITFSAHAIGNRTDDRDARSPIFLRALVDGVVIEPGEVRFAAASTEEDPGAFTFVATDVAQGIHNVRFQWRIEDDDWEPALEREPLGKLHGANVSVIVDSERTEVAGFASVTNAATADLFEHSGPLGSTGEWEALTDPETGGPLTVMAHVRQGAVTTATLSAELSAGDFTTLEVRAKVDDSTAAVLFDEVALAQRFPTMREGTAHPQPYDQEAVRSFTFPTAPLAEGWHKFTFEARVRIEGTESYPHEFEQGIRIAPILARSIAVVSTVNDPLAGIEVAVATAESTIDGAPVSGFEVVEGLSTTVTVPESSQVIVRFDASVRDLDTATLRLTDNGSPVVLSERELLAPVMRTATITTDYVLKRLPAGVHEFEIEWEGTNGTTLMEMNARSLVARVEPLHTPDLGRGPDIAAGASGQTVERHALHALDGQRRVLPVLVDPERPEIARVVFKANRSGSYTLVVKGKEFSYATNPGDGAVDVAAALRSKIEAEPNFHVSVVTPDPEFFCLDGCVTEFLLVATQLGLDTLTPNSVLVTPQTIPQPMVPAVEVMQISDLVRAPFVQPEAIDELIFGGGASSDVYWLQQSRGLLDLVPAYESGSGTTYTRVLGPVAPDSTGLSAVTEYWQRSYTCDPLDALTHPYDGGHVRRDWEALVRANADFDIDFSEFDIDGDGIVERHELVIVFIIPQENHSGYRRSLDPFCSGAPNEAVLDGVTLDPDMLQWYMDAGSGGYRSARWASHELGHALELDDMYIKIGIDDGEDLGCVKGNCTEHEPWGKSIMDGPLSSDMQWSELDGVQKLAFGWVTPRTIRSSQTVTLDPVRSGREVLVLPRAGSGGREYFLVENRVNRAAFDLWSEGFDIDIGDQGLAVWHVIEPESAEYWEFDGVAPDLGCWTTEPDDSDCQLMGAGDQCPAVLDGFDLFGAETENFVRRSVRLLRPGADGRAQPDGSMALWSSATGPMSNAGSVCGPGLLLWSDGSSSPYQLTNLSAPGASMTLCVEVDGVPCP